MIGIKVLKGNKGGLIFRTIFPVTEDKIQAQVRKGFLKKIK